MSYQVIARKWRPQTFSQLVGQSHVSQVLLNSLSHHRLHHALLFTGPRGTGKTSTARILAKSLRCLQLKEFVPCHECRECQDIASGRSIDVIEIDGASNNGVDAIRELRETVGYMPSSGSHKMYIIDEVHMLSTSAFNALLKTLEEPPPNVIFVLATTEVHKIPSTILSRCQRFDFRRISTKSIASHLEEICRQEGVIFTPESLWLIARQADGSMRDSQSLLDQVITFSGKSLKQDQVVEVLGLTDRHLLLESLEGLLQRDYKKIIQVIEKIFTAGYDPKIFIQDLLEELRHLLLIKLLSVGSSSVGIVDLPDSEYEHLKNLSEKLSEGDIHLLFDMALKGGTHLLKTPDTKVVFEMLLLKMASAPRWVDILSVSPSSDIDRLSQSTDLSETQNIQRTSVDQNFEDKQGNQENTDEVQRSKWVDLISRIKKINPMVGSKLEHTSFLGLDKKVIRLGIPGQMRFLSSQIEDKEFQKKLLNYVGTFWGLGYSIETHSSRSDSQNHLSANALNEKKKQEEISQERELVENHPFVKSAQSVFKSQIKAIKETK